MLKTVFSICVVNLTVYNKGTYDRHLARLLLRLEASYPSSLSTSLNDKSGDGVVAFVFHKIVERLSFLFIGAVDHQSQFCSGDLIITVLPNV